MPPKSNAEIRKWYLDQLTRIPSLNQQWIEKGISLKERALRAWGFRHRRRSEARTFMANEHEVEMLRQRDLAVYGSPNGPTFGFL
jgi:hypothetical protein